MSKEVIERSDFSEIFLTRVDNMLQSTDVHWSLVAPRLTDFDKISIRAALDMAPEDRWDEAVKLYNWGLTYPVQEDRRQFLRQAIFWLMPDCILEKAVIAIEEL